MSGAIGSTRSANCIDAVQLISSSQSVGVFDIDLHVSSVCPHIVHRVGDMLDVNGGAITTVAVGDKLTHVDGRSTHVDGLHIGEDMILGEENTCVELRLVSGTTGKEYSVVARRHVFVRKREQVTKRFEVRPDLLRQDLTVEPKLVQTLDKVRRMIADPAGNVIDLLDGVGSLGLRVGKEIPDKALPPLQITEMSPCGPAALSRQIDRGDEIVGVDDVAANEANIISLLHGSYGNVRHTVGSRVKLQLRRNGKTFEIHLHRAAGDQFAALNDVLAFVHEQQDRLSSSNMSEGDMISVCADIKKMLLDFRERRMVQELALSTRLSCLQLKILNTIESSFALIRPNKESELLFAKTELEIEFALSREKHRANESYTTELRTQLEEVQAQNSTLQAEYDTLKKQQTDLKFTHESANANMNKLTLQLQDLRSSAKELQRSLDEANVQLGVKTKALDETSRQLVSKTETIQELELAMQKSVTEEAYVKELELALHKSVTEVAIAQNQMAAYKKEADLSAKKAEEMQEQSRQLQISNAQIKSQLKNTRKELDEIKDSSVSREKHVDLRGKMLNCEDELKSKTLELQRLLDEHEELKHRFEDLQRSSADVGILRSTSEVDLLKFKEAEEKVLVLESELQKEKQKHANFLKDISSANDLGSFKSQIESLKKQLQASVPRADWVVLSKTSNALQNENIHLKTDIGSMQAPIFEQVNVVKSLIKELIATRRHFSEEAAQMFPASMYAELQAKAKSLEHELHLQQKETKNLREEVQILREEVQISKQEVDDLQQQMSGMVQHSLWQEVDIKANAFQQDNAALKVELTALEEKIQTLNAMLANMVDKDPMLAAQRRVDEMEKTLNLMQGLLNMAGLSDTEDMTAFFYAVIGPPRFDARELTDMLHVIRSMARCQVKDLMALLADVNKFGLTFTEVRQLLQATQGGEGDAVWHMSEVVHLLTVMRKHPQLKVPELYQMLGICNSLPVLQRLCNGPVVYDIGIQTPWRFSKHLGGIGLLLEELLESKGGGIYVKAVIDGGPASEDSRIRVGDQVWKIDGETVSGKPLQLVKSLLRGTPDSLVQLDMIQGDYRKSKLDKFVDPGTLPPKAFFFVQLCRKESEYYELDFETQHAAAHVENEHEYADIQKYPNETGLLSGLATLPAGLLSISSTVWATTPTSQKPSPSVASEEYDVVYPQASGKKIGSNTHAYSVTWTGSTNSAHSIPDDIITEPGIYVMPHSDTELLAM